MRALVHTPTQCTVFCRTDHDHREGFVAIVDAYRGGQDLIVGHLCLEPDRSGAAEVAIAVAEEFQHQGIGGRLLTEGIAWARRERIAQLTATMFAGNTAIHRLFTGSGLPACEKYDRGRRDRDHDRPGPERHDQRGRG